VACTRDALYIWGWLSLGGTSKEYKQNTGDATDNVPYHKIVTPVSLQFFEGYYYLFGCAILFLPFVEKGTEVTSVACGIWHTSVVVLCHGRQKLFVFGNEQYEGYMRPYCPFYSENFARGTHSIRTVKRIIPDEVFLPDQSPIKKISAGASFTVALLENGKLFGFGQNPRVCPAAAVPESDDQEIHINSADGFANERHVYRLSTGHEESRDPFVDVDCGTNHVVGVTERGHVFAWGHCFDKITFDVDKPIKIMDGVSLVKKAACGLDFNVLY
jgi:alpha-tubulin suppressor-like RCC1 family protein